MIIYPSLPSGHTIFCDDVRQEASGKQTLVGTYGTSMLVSEFPAMLPQICCVISYREAPEATGKVAIRVIHEINDDETVMAEILYDIPEGSKPPAEMEGPFIMRTGSFLVQISPFAIEGPGLLKVRAFRDDDEIRLGALKISHAPPPQPESDAASE